MIPSLFFCVDIQHSEDLAEVLRGHGHRVHAVSGKTPKTERKRLVEEFRRGELDGLTSCEIFSVGFDSPIAMGAWMARPTMSGLWYRQAVGRVLRPYPAPQGERAYQTAALRSIQAAYAKGTINQLMVCPTGTGKTNIAAQLPDLLYNLKTDLSYRGRLMFLVFREELAQQAAATFAARNPSMRVGIEQAGSHADGADIVIAGLQTIGRNQERLACFDPATFDAVVTDEAHFAAVSKMYRNIYQHMRVLKQDEHRDPEVLHLGVTATPNRCDSIGLEIHYDEIVYNYGLREAIEEGYLADIKAFRVETSVDVSDVKKHGEDFQVAALGKAINTPARNELIARKYLEVSKAENMEAPLSNIGLWRKPHGLIVDFADISGRHSLITAPSLLGLPSRFNPCGDSVLEQVKQIEKLEANQPGLDLRGQPNMDRIHAMLKEIDLLAPPEIPEEIRKVSKYSWLRDGAQAYRLTLTDRTMLSVRQNALGQFTVYHHVNGIMRPIGVSTELKVACRIAEGEMTKRDVAVNSEKKWVADPPTVKQANRLWMLDRKVRAKFGSSTSFYEHCQQRFGLHDPDYTKGALSRMISVRMS